MIFNKSERITNVAERDDAPGHWGVETIYHGDDDQVLVAFFSGPDAEKAARSYAASLGFPSAST